MLTFPEGREVNKPHILELEKKNHILTKTFPK
jgi:hypothetical protein